MQCGTSGRGRPQDMQKEFITLSWWSQLLHDLLHCWAFMRKGFPTAPDNIPRIVIHFWTFQPAWALSTCDESRNLELGLSLERNSIKEYLCKTPLNTLKKLRNAWPHRIIKRTKCIYVRFHCFTLMLHFLTFIASGALCPTAFNACAK